MDRLTKDATHDQIMACIDLILIEMTLKKLRQVRPFSASRLKAEFKRLISAHRASKCFERTERNPWRYHSD